MPITLIISVVVVIPGPARGSAGLCGNAASSLGRLAQPTNLHHINSRPLHAGLRRGGDMQRAREGCQPRRDPKLGRHGGVTLSSHTRRCRGFGVGARVPGADPAGDPKSGWGFLLSASPQGCTSFEPWAEAGGNQCAQGQRLAAGRPGCEPRARGGEGRALSDASSSRAPSAGDTACHLRSRHLTGETVVMTNRVAAPLPLGLS